MEDFERHFRNKLQDFDQLPPAESWKTIKEVLDEDQRRNRRWLILPFVILGAIVIQPGADDLSIRDSYHTLAERVTSSVNTDTSGNSMRGNTLAQICEEEDVSITTIETPGEDARRMEKVGSRQLAIGKVGVEDILSTGGREQSKLNEGKDQNDRELFALYGKEILPALHSLSDSLPLFVKAEVKKKKNVVAKTSEKEDKDKKESHWTLQPEFGLNYTMRKIQPAEDIYYLTALNNKNKVSVKNTGYQLGLKARYELNKRNTLLVGMSWNKLRETTDYDYFNIIADSVEIAEVTSTYIKVNTYSKARRNVVINSMDYISLNVGLMHTITLLHREYRTLLEVQMNNKVFSKHITEADDQRFTVTGTQAFIRGGIERTYRINERTTLTVTPFFRHSLGSIYGSESVYRLKALQLGVDVGLLLPFYQSNATHRGTQRRHKVTQRK